MAHIVRAKYLRYFKIYAYIYAVVILVGGILDLLEVIRLSLLPIAVVLATLPVVYYWLLFAKMSKRFGRRAAYVIGVVLMAVPMLLIAISTDSYMTLFVNSTALAALIFLSAMVGPSTPVGLVWIIGVGYIIAFSGHIPSLEAIRVTILLLVGYVVAAFGGWLVFRRYYIREDPELEHLRRTLRGEQLKSEGVIAAINDGVAIVDRSGMAVHTNPRLLEMIGTELIELKTKPYGEVVGTRLRIVSSTSKTPKIDQNIAEVFRTGVSINIDSITAEYVDGRGVADFSASISPLKNEDGEISAVMVMLRDISNLMKLQRMKDELIMTASHELRTPITVIAGYADLLLGTEAANLNDKQRHYLERTKETTAHLTQMVNDMLDISRLESNQRENVPVPLNAQSILESIVEGKLSFFAGKQLSLYLEASPAKIFADESRFRQVVSNLLSNAYKFTPEDGKVTLSAKVVGNMYEVSVMDTGPGIPDERWEEVFEKFTKLDRTGSIPGTGLGLAIARNIVDNWGGTIGGENRTEGGARFHFTVPLTQDQHKDEQVAKGTT